MERYDKQGLLPHLPEKSDCCGCAVCVDTCTQEAISLQEDEDGYYFPVVNSCKCVGCKLCEKNCHILHQDEIKRYSRLEEKAYSSWTTNKELLKHSSSGGVFAQLAFDFLSDSNSVVCGAQLLEDSSVKHVIIDNADDLHLLQQSKYKQSVSIGIYKALKEALKNGTRVLFSGTPCQVASLYHYLHYNPTLIERLYTIEVICHGQPSNYLSELALRIHHASGIWAFRTKSNGWRHSHRMVYKFKDGSINEIPASRDFLTRSYLASTSLRESCYSCKYANMDRVADVTLGDFWYYGKRTVLQNYDGTSLVTVNSDKGRELWDESTSLKKNDITLDLATCSSPSFYMPTLYPYMLSKRIHYIKHLPIFLQKRIFQNGFDNRLLAKVCSVFTNRVLLGKKRKAAEVFRKSEVNKCHL